MAVIQKIVIAKNCTFLKVVLQLADLSKHIDFLLNSFIMQNTCWIAWKWIQVSHFLLHA